MKRKRQTRQEKEKRQRSILKKKAFPGRSKVPLKHANSESQIKWKRNFKCP
jgi:hypothetical protein